MNIDHFRAVRKGRRRVRLSAMLAAFLGLAAFEAQAQFLDDFDRPAADAIGNGWIEKTPAAFSLAGNGARKNANPSDYTNNLVYRPSNENLLDVEVAVELELDVVQGAYAQIMTRVQSETVAFEYWLDGYMLYLDGGVQGILGRQTGWSFVTTLAELELSEPLNTTDTYRLRLRSVGVSPVQLDAFIERRVATGWEVIGSASYQDSSAERITTPGSVGFGGYVEGGYVFDNFSRLDLGGATNPAPVLSGISPSTAPAGASAFSLTVQGSSFIPESIVRWNGDDRATTFVSPSQLQAAITAEDLADEGTAVVTVFTPTPGGGLSDGVVFTIDGGAGANPQPVLSGLVPGSAVEGSGPLVVTVQGSGFVAESTVRFAGENRATTFVSPTELTAAITAGDLAEAGTAEITVVNPAPGGGESGGATFTIEPEVVSNPIPSVSSLSPSSVIAGSGGFSLTVQGDDFLPGSVVRVDGNDRATTYVSPTELAAEVTAGDVAGAGSLTVTVFNPAPGGGVSAGRTLTVTPLVPDSPAPAIVGLDVDFALAGSQETTLTLFGSSFEPGTVVRWNGEDRPTTYVSSEVLEFALSEADLAVPGVGTVTVRTPDPGGDTSAPQPFFVLGPGQGFFFDNFNAADSEEIGNDWTEKYPGAFSLVDNQVEGVVTWGNIVYRDSIVYRPEMEDRRDVEVAMEFVRRPGSEFAQVHARVQRDIVAMPNFLESYILYIEDGYPSPGGFAIAVQPGIDSMGECLMSFTPFPQALEVGGRYRLRLRVIGEYPVQLSGAVDVFDGEAWQELASESLVHDNATQRDPNLYCAPGYMPPPIRDGGATGFSKWWTLSDYYDNFYWLDLGTDVQTPEISSLSPEFAEAGTSGFDLLVTGEGFTADSVVQWNGVDRPTTFISSGMLRAAIPAADIAAVGSAAITVASPGAVSTPASFDIVQPGSGINPVPDIEAIGPEAFTAGAGNGLLTVDGAGFVSASVVRWNGADLATTYVSPTRLVAQVPAGLLTAPGAAAVTIFNPAPAGGLSLPVSVQVVSAQAFVDLFDRSDSPNIGNGWIEKDPFAFSLDGGRVVKAYSYSGYTDNVVYRPAAEAVLDSEVSAELRLLNAQNPGYAQVFARLQPSTVQQGSWLDGYMLYLNDSPTQAILGRQRGAAFVTTLAVINLTEPLDVQSTYRLRLEVSGTGSVDVAGYVERLSPGGWVAIGSASVTDTSSSRIDAPGIAGFSGYVEASYSFDNFIWLAN